MAVARLQGFGGIGGSRSRVCTSFEIGVSVRFAEWEFIGSEVSGFRF